MSSAEQDKPVHDHAAPASSKPFRFKRELEGSHGTEDGHRDRRSRRYRHHHRQHKRRRLSHDDSSRRPECHTSSLPPEDAFRESLFDALADDEGADFWQGVYGQPIHNIPRTYMDADTGELGTMDDEQYAQYVRRRMWEKSAEGIAAAREVKRREQKQERERRDQTRREVPKDTRSLGREDFAFDIELDESLRRGERRKEKKRFHQLWEAYLDKWRDLQEMSEARKGQSADDNEQVYLRNKIAWPVESGKRYDTTPENIENFFVKVSEGQSTDDNRARDTMASILKGERVRWHPDKIQQRYGFMNIEQSTMGTVTAVFQVLDRLWNETRHNNQM